MSAVVDGMYDCFGSRQIIEKLKLIHIMKRHPVFAAGCLFL